ncbi:MAG TPA: c-type cytochrome [Anaerolineales bacterium]|nr:c-type cytochrome [Anaerolineales bacterium]
MSALVAIAALVATAGLAAAGGWAVVTLDSLPGKVVAGETLTIGFTVRQHGRTPISGLDPAPDIEATRPDSRETVRVVARDEGGAGHYTADLTLPSAGSWQWSIRAFGSTSQPMPTIVVVPSPQAQSAVGGPADILLWAGAAALAALAIGLALRRRVVWSAAAILAAVLAAGAAYSRGASAPAAEAAPAAMAATGAQLFLAKGCLACHVHTEIPESEAFSLRIGPDLSHYRNDPAFLARWLADPAAVRAATGMPDLGLSEGEIRALIAFLDGDEGG